VSYTLKSFDDIVNAVIEELKVPSSDTTTINRIKRRVNGVYRDEVVPFSKWEWARGFTAIKVGAYYTGGTATVTTNSTTVTLSTVIPSGNGSKARYYFTVDGFSEIYEIASHTAGTAALTLSEQYTGTSSSSATFKIWTDRFALPTDCKETVLVWHDYSRQPLDGVGQSEYQRIKSAAGLSQARPAYYTVTDFYDPSAGTEVEATRYRELRAWPAILDKQTTLHVDYIKEVTELSATTDEPILPAEDRIVLVYGTLAWAWSAIARNPEEAARNQLLYNAKLARMAGKMRDVQEKPKLVPSSIYLKTKRGVSKGGFDGDAAIFGAAGSGGPSMVTYMENGTINGANVTGTITVSSGVTIDGIDISADAATQAAHIAATSGVHGVTGSVVGTSDTQTLTNKSIDADSNTITNIENADIKSGANIALSKLAALTATKVAVTDSSGVLSTSSVTPTELTFLTNAVPLTSVALSDNQASAANVLTYAKTYTAAVIDYSISRGAANVRCGQLFVSNDGTNPSIADSSAEIGTSGVTLTADISGANVRIRYTSTSTGTAPTFKYTMRPWAA
jgi:hypothetical protein